jgi:hypothetical protein
MKKRKRKRRWRATVKMTCLGRIGQRRRGELR